MEDSTKSAGEEVETSRRKFLKRLIGFFAILNSIILGVPFIRSLISSPIKKRGGRWSKVTAIASLKEGKPADIRFQTRSEESHIEETILLSAWVIKRSPTEVTVYAPNCPHLGCHYLWNQKTDHFECPCHASVFDINGEVLGGPAPRPLDTLKYKIENGVLFVEWQVFKTGTPEKIPVYEL